MIKFLYAGNVPYFSVFLMAAICLYAGMEYQKYVDAKSLPKIAFAQKGAIIFESALSKTDVSENTLKQEIQLPILSVIKKYVDQGYLVIDSSKNEQGNYTVDGIPKGAIDISDEMRKALLHPIQEVRK